MKEGVPLPAACARAGLGYLAGRDALLRGELRGWQDERGRWQVDPTSLKEFIAAKDKRPRVRPARHRDTNNGPANTAA